LPRQENYPTAVPMERVLVLRSMRLLPNPSNDPMANASDEFPFLLMEMSPSRDRGT
jgi:hypothetical protein